MEKVLRRILVTPGSYSGLVSLYALGAVDLTFMSMYGRPGPVLDTENSDDYH